MPPVESGVREYLRGVATGFLTPFDDDLDTEHDELAANATVLYDEGIRAFPASVSINEYHSLTRQERIDVTTTVVDAFLLDVCVLAGVGGSATGTHELIDACGRIDVDGMMIIPPDHTYIHEHGLLRYYEKLTGVPTTPLVPYVKGFNPSINYLRDLAGLDDVAGIKCIIGGVVKPGAAVSTTGDDVAWVDGPVESFAVLLRNEGIEGFSVGMSNFRPGTGLVLSEALTEENWGHARGFWSICLPYQNFRDQTRQNDSLDGTIGVLAVEKGFELVSLRGRAVRESVRSLSADDEHRTEELYDQLDDDIERLVD